MQLSKIVIGLLFAFAVICSCTKVDEFKKYVEGGEIIYAGKPDSVKVQPGKKRAQLVWLALSDPAIAKAKVYWNNRKDSVEIAVQRTVTTDTIRVMINNLQEGNYDFEIYNYDKNNNASIKVQASGRVYGDVYSASLLNRTMLNAEVQGNTAQVTWNDADSTTGIIGMQLLYTDTGNALHDTIIKAIYKDQVTALPGFKPGEQLQYRTLYKPGVLAIDTFYSSYEMIPVKADVTALYIKNPGAPFLRDDTQYYDWRWGQLLYWQYNTAAGSRYTFDAINGMNNACLTMWIWGNGPLVNAKIYQTVLLPAGQYTFEATVSNIDNTLEATYLAVATGNALPDVANVSTALAYGRFTDNSNKLVSASFTLPAAATVTLGVVGSMANPTEQTLRVGKVKLVKLK